MTNHELNAQIAEEVMGWVRHDWREHDALQKTAYCFVCGQTRAKTARDMRPNQNHGDDCLPLSLADRTRDYCQPPHETIPDYSGSLDAAGQMEEEIERRGLHGKYAASLLQELGLPFPLRCPNTCGLSSFWRLIHVTPEQRCQAALSAMRTEALEAVK